jgi:ligand-binding sensor domain-containing protein
MERAHLTAVLRLAMVLACCSCVFALDPSLDISQYAHTSWKIRDGFINGSIVAIAQSSDGYLWLGTEFGLARFDGVRAVPWQPPTGQQLPSNNILTLLFARDDTLWIGTLSGLASWRDGQLTTYPEMEGQMIISLLQDREGAIWAGGSRHPELAKLCSIQNASTSCNGGMAVWEPGSLVCMKTRCRICGLARTTVFGNGNLVLQSSLPPSRIRTASGALAKMMSTRF